MATFKRYLILIPITRADYLEKILQIRKLDATVESTSSGAIVYRDLPVKEYLDWDISELLGSADLGQEDQGEDLENVTDGQGTHEPADLATATIGEVSVPREDVNNREAESAANSLTDDSEFTALSSADPIFVAKELSKYSPYGVLLFTVELGEEIGGEAGVSGLVNVKRVVAKQVTEELAPGLVLAVLDARIEELLIQAPRR